MTIRQRLRWFADYYLLKVILITAGAALFLFLLKMAMLPGIQPEAEILVIAPLKGDYSGVEDALSQKLGYDKPDGEVRIEYMEEQTAFSGTSLGMKLSSGEFDAVIAEREHFHFFEDSGLLADLEEISEGEIRNVQEDRLVWYEAGQDDAQEITEAGAVIPGAALKESCITGISLKENEFYAACTEYLDDPVLGIIRSTDDTEEEKEILKSTF